MSQYSISARTSNTGALGTISRLFLGPSNSVLPTLTTGVLRLWTGYQAEDAEMVTVNSPSADGEAELLYPAGVDVSVAAGSTSDSDTHIADDSTSTVLTDGAQQSLPAADMPDNNMLQSSVTELPDNGGWNDENCR